MHHQHGVWMNLQRSWNEKKKGGQIVLPIFYNVDPSEVRKQTGTYAQAFEEHETCFKENIDKVHKWRAILTDVSNLSRWPLEGR